MTKTIVENPKSTIQLISFDIFDTLVTRRVATPVGIFALMQENLKKNSDFTEFFKCNFFSIRKDAETMARIRLFKIENTREIMFDDIYELIQQNYNLSNAQKEYLKTLEIETEIKNLVPLEKNIVKLKEYIESGKRVVLISDMYFSSQDLKQMLTHIDPIFSNIKIYVSGENKACKGDGSLYKIVQSFEGVSYSKWQHTGDNKLSDIKRARELGIKVNHTPQITLLPYENIINSKQDNLYFQCSIGSAKLARLEKIEKHQDIYDFGVSFAAPILYNYVDFVIEQALSRGFKTLYFIARDGYIPKIIADIIIEKRNLNLKTKYLYGSRLAWRIPTEKNFDSLIDILLSEYREKLSIEFLSYRLAIDKNKLEELLNISNSKKKYSNTDIKNLANLLKKEQIKNEIIKSNEARKTRLLHYLEQEIDFSESNIAFIDLYGSGNTQDLLISLLNEKYNLVGHTFYLINYSMIQKFNSKKYSYCNNCQCAVLLELLSRSYDGQTIDFDYIDNLGQTAPITEQVNGIAMIEWGLNEYIKGIKNFTIKHSEITQLNSFINLNNRNLVYEFINFIRFRLDKKTADILGTIPYKSIGQENSIEDFAPKISFINCLKNFLTCRHTIKKAYAPTIIMQARSSKSAKKMLKFTEKYPTIQKFLFNIYIHKRDKEAYIRILGIKISFGGLLWKGKRNVN